MKHLALLAALLAVPACSSHGKSGDDDTDTGADSDSDTDVDSDSDADADNDTDTDSDTDTAMTVECPADSLFANPLDITDMPWAVVSDTNREREIATGFETAGGTIEHIKFWGVNQIYITDLMGWVNCLDDPANFIVRFYTDSTFETVEHEFYFDDVVPVITGVPYDYHPDSSVFEYTVELPTGVDLTDGLLSIVGDTISDCWFLWLALPEQSDESYVLVDGEWGPSYHSYAFCLGGTPDY